MIIMLHDKVIKLRRKLVASVRPVRELPVGERRLES